MEVIKNSISSIIGMFFALYQQGVIGWVACGRIVYIFAKYRKKSNEIANKYEELTNIMKNANYKEGSKEKEFESDIITKIVDDFKESTKIGTNDVNTEVIIEKNLSDEEVLNSEKEVKNAASACIAIGLLGTFLGLTAAIMQTRGVLGDTLGSTRMFGKAMEAPFGSMSAAFLTSIFGVGSSLLLNNINIKMERAKDKFYDNMEDYLDNTIYGMYAVNLISQFNQFNKTVENNLRQLTGEITYLFREGVETLVADINKNNLDLTDTVKALTKYTKDLDRLTSSLDKSVNNFKEPVEKFKTSIEEYIQNSESASLKVKESTDKFSRNVEVLDTDFRSIENIVNNNKIELKDIGDSLKINLNTISSKQEDLINRTKEVIAKNKESQDELIVEVQKIGNIYNNFTDTLNGFNNKFGKTQEEVGNNITTRMSERLNDVSDGIVSRISTVLNRVENTTEGLEEMHQNVGKILKETNDLNRDLIKEKMNK